MKSLQGQLLIASHKLLDPNFAKTVTLMVQHNEEGAVGLVLNRPTQMLVSTAWKQVAETPCLYEDVIYTGGPCPGPLMVLHGQERASDTEVVPAVPGVGAGPDDHAVHFCTEPDKVHWLVERGEGPARFFVGYAGWGAGQLEAECEQDSWLVAPASVAVVFGPSERLWHRLMREKLAEMGLPPMDPDLLPADPSMN